MDASEACVSPCAVTVAVRCQYLVGQSNEKRCWHDGMVDEMAIMVEIGTTEQGRLIYSFPSFRRYTSAPLYIPPKRPQRPVPGQRRKPPPPWQRRKPPPAALARNPLWALRNARAASQTGFISGEPSRNSKASLHGPGRDVRRSVRRARSASCGSLMLSATCASSRTCRVSKMALRLKLEKASLDRQQTRCAAAPQPLHQPRPRHQRRRPQKNLPRHPPHGLRRKL